MAYPGVLSAPFIAWRFGDEDWTALCADSPLETPVAVKLRTDRGRFAIALRPAAPCAILRIRVQGTWQDLAKALRRRWDPPPNGPPLSHVFDGIHFYVHQWISAEDAPALRIDWTIDELVERMRREPPGTLQHVYGFDPGGVDLGGEYFWSADGPAKVRAVLGANPRLSHLAWLNLRTYKYAIPRLGLERPLTPRVLAGARRCSSGPPARERQYAYELIEMCLASPEWQQSRLRQFDRLADLGFKVIQLDEFPVPRRWSLVPCSATGHLHGPGDAAGEWREILRFLDVLARRARQRGIHLICEEPSVGLLPYTCGYVDRQYNQTSEFYSIWNGSPPARPVPLFSSMYGGRATPCTDINPDRHPPSGWLVNRKQARPPRR